MIDREELALGAALPTSLRQFLLASNGGEVDGEDDVWQVFPVRDDTDRKRLTRTASHIARETSTARRWDGFPAEGIAIASNGSGDYLVVLPSKDDVASGAAAIYFWDHDSGALSLFASDWSAIVGPR